MAGDTDGRSRTTGEGDDVPRYLLSIEYPDANAPIRGRSILDLYRAFSVGGLVAFVGSGTSVLLGYRSWSGFSRAFAATAQGNEECRDGGTVAGRSPPDLPGEYAELLNKSLSGLLDASGDEADDPVAILSLARELAQQRDLPHNRRGSEHAHAVKRQLEGTLRKLFQIKHGVKVAASRSRWFKCPLAELADWSCARPVPSADDVSDSHEHLPIDLEKAVELLDFAAVSKEPLGADGVRLPPTPREERLSAKRPLVDILACLRNDWRISRYVTLNYDLEIERALEHYDFPFYSLTVPVREHAGRVGDSTETAAPRLEWDDVSARAPIVRSRLGERGRSIDLGPENAGELMLFAANYPSGLIQVIHLHGSVRDPSRMIVTDSDYNDRYFTPGGWSATLGDGQEMLFRGNAIVFFGVGMGEEELLRPLRLLAQAPNRESRPVFAFLESEGDNRDTATALKLYQRYGVRTLFVGTKLRRNVDPEFGSFSDHPLIRDVRSIAPELLRKTHIDEDIAELSSLRQERVVLWAMQAFVKALGPKKGAAKRTTDIADSSLLAIADRAFAVFAKKAKPIFKVPAPAWKKNADGSWPKAFLDALYSAQHLPRLRTTPGHAVVFHYIFGRLFSRRIEDLRAVRAATPSYLAALNSLESAIRARALHDGLVFFSGKALEWRRRWTHFPGGGMDEPPPPKAGCFRKPDTGNDKCVALWHVAKRRKKHGTDADSEQPWIEQLPVKGTALTIARWAIGRGKGEAIASLTRSTSALDADYRRRWIISFANSCEFDSCFDVLADMLRWLSEMPGKRHAQCVVMQTDLIFSRNHGMPKLAEWHLMFRRLLLHSGVHLVVFCEFPQTSGYFRRLCESFQPGRAENRPVWPHLDGAPKPQGAGVPTDSVKLAQGTRNVWLPFGKISAPPPIDASAFARLHEPNDIFGLGHIIALCGSQWLAAFLFSILEHDPIGTETQESKPGVDTFRAQMVEDIEHGLRLVQDPRQRVSTVIDIAMSHIERRVVSLGDDRRRRTKILAHCILKHLFAFGNAIEQDVLFFCPEIIEILASYRVAQAEHRSVVVESVNWLIHHHLAVEIESRNTRAEGRRLSLHNQVRRYLASKKGLPFEIVQGREKTAVTLLPVLEEEAASLDTDDMVFLGKLFDALIDPDRRVSTAEVSDRCSVEAPGPASATMDASLEAERIRAAFGLMRGSLRIGIVLRATPASSEHGSLSPLDEYLRRLLAIRRAVLRNADMVDFESRTSVVWPLYEREWVWLFNELGVVRMVQGCIHDAMPLFEAALRFEERRLRQAGAGEYERWIHRNHDFSLTKIRILLNLCLATTERGDFERVSRIVRRAHIDLGNLAGVPVYKATAQGGISGGNGFRSKPEDHREVRILRQVCILVEARVAYLSGAMGGMQGNLDAQRNEVVSLGIHGLTAWFHQILSDVQRAKGDLVQVAQSLKVALVEAEASGRPDLILAVMLSEADYLRDARIMDSSKRLRHQLARLRKIELECRRLGLLRIEVTMCLVRSKLYLSFGELRSAREDAMNALTLATTQGLKIKRIAGLIVMAALFAASDDSHQHDQRKEAAELVETARQEAERIGYKLAAVSARELEIVLRGKGTVEGWASGELSRELDMPGAGGSAG